MTITSVIFDLDGTITEPFFDFDAIREEIGLSRDAGPLLELMEDMDEEELTRTKQILEKYEKQAVKESELNKGVTKTIDALRDMNIKVGILTRNTRDNALAIAKKHNLTFDGIVDRHDGPVKPDAFGVLELCSQFGTDSKEALVVGDYLFDLLSAKSAGATAVLLKTHDKAQDFSRHADFTINQLDQVLEIIEDIHKR